MQTNITITVLVVSVIIIENCTFIQCTVYIYDCSFTFAFFIKRNHIICQNIFYIHVGRTGFTSIHIHTHTLNTLQNTDGKYESGSRYPEEAPMWRFPEIGVPLNHPCYFRIFPHKQSSNWGSPNLGNLHTVSISIMSQHAKPGWFVNHWWNP